MSCTAKAWKWNTAMQSDIAWSVRFILGFIFQVPSLTLQFPLQWRCFVSEGLSFPWAVLWDPVQHPVESGVKEASWEIGRPVARKWALAKRRGLPDCLNSHWTKEQGGPVYPSNLQTARSAPKLSFEMSWNTHFDLIPVLLLFLMDFSISWGLTVDIAMGLL